MQGNLKITANVSEKDFMESCLNITHSGYDVTLTLVFYALAKRWNINKLMYYMRLLDSPKRNLLGGTSDKP